MKDYIGVYIHIPFCVRKCLYCDFLSGASDEVTRQKYVDVICAEIKLDEQIRNKKVDTVYFGGGTPSLLDIKSVDRIFNTINKCFHFTDKPEITFEMNPGTVNEEKMSYYKSVGINRLSIGMQSANDEELKYLGRIYSIKQFDDVYELACKNGFDNINIDVMSAIPGQTIESYEKTMRKVIHLNPTHISSYSLIIEENTPYNEMFSGKNVNDTSFVKYGLPILSLPDEETERNMYELTGKLLGENGYTRYEISNYSKPGYESRHNSSYWTGREYVGYGAGAASLINDIRITNVQSVKKYMDAFPNIEKERLILTLENQMEEFMFLGLRMMNGIKKSEFLSRFGVNIDNVYGSVIYKMKKDMLLTEESGRIMLTDRGIDISNYVMSEFLL